MKRKQQVHVRVKKYEHENGVQIREIIHDGVTLENIYTQNGKVLPRIGIEGYLADQIKAFTLLDKDLRNVIEWLKIAQEIDDESDGNNAFLDGSIKYSLIIKSLFVSILTTYGKCFTQATGRRFTLNKKHIPTEYVDFHEKIINARHNYAAHKGMHDHEDCRVSLVIFNKWDARPFEIFTELRQHSFLIDQKTPVVIADFIELCESLRRILNEKKSTVIEKITREKILTIKEKQWLKMKGKSISLD